MCIYIYIYIDTYTHTDMYIHTTYSPCCRRVGEAVWCSIAPWALPRNDHTDDVLACLGLMNMLPLACNRLSIDLSLSLSLYIYIYMYILITILIMCLLLRGNPVRAHRGPGCHLDDEQHWDVSLSLSISLSLYMYVLYVYIYIHIYIYIYIQ